MRINLTKGLTHISIVDGHHKSACGRYWMRYKANAVCTKSLAWFFIILN